MEKKEKQRNFFSGRSVPDPKMNSSFLTLDYSPFSTLQIPHFSEMPF